MGRIVNVILGIVLGLSVIANWIGYAITGLPDIQAFYPFELLIIGVIIWMAGAHNAFFKVLGVILGIGAILQILAFFGLNIPYVLSASSYTANIFNGFALLVALVLIFYKPRTMSSQLQVD